MAGKIFSVVALTLVLAVSVYGASEIFTDINFVVLSRCPNNPEVTINAWLGTVSMCGEYELPYFVDYYDTWHKNLWNKGIDVGMKELVYCKECPGGGEIAARWCSFLIISPEPKCKKGFRCTWFSMEGYCPIDIKTVGQKIKEVLGFIDVKYIIIKGLAPARQGQGRNLATSWGRIKS